MEEIDTIKRAMEEEDWLQKAVGAWGRSQEQRAWSLGFSWATPLLGHSKPLIAPSMAVVVTTSAPAAPASKLFLPRYWSPKVNWQRRDQPSCQELAWSLREGNVPETTVNFPQEDTHAKPLDWDCHYDDDVHMIAVRCQGRLHLYWLIDCLYEPC